MLKLICIDLDGVCCDWLGGICQLFDKDLIKVMAEWPRGSKSYHKALGVQEEDLWRAVDGAGEKFWVDLQMLPWAKDLLALCKRMAPIIFATSSTLHPSSASGKVLWMQKHFGRHFRDYLIGPKKECLARPGTVLIDDLNRNIDKFIEAGGHGYLIPQPWNNGDKEFSLADLEKFLTSLK